VYWGYKIKDVPKAGNTLQDHGVHLGIVINLFWTQKYKRHVWNERTGWWGHHCFSEGETQSPVAAWLRKMVLKVDGRLSAQAMDKLQGLSRLGSAKSEWGRLGSLPLLAHRAPQNERGEGCWSPLLAERARQINRICRKSVLVQARSRRSISPAPKGERASLEGSFILLAIATWEKGASWRAQGWAGENGDRSDNALHPSQVAA